MARKNNHARDYVSITYDEETRPITGYPALLADYLVKRYKMSKGRKILDLGCGRGEFLKGFISCGLQGYGLPENDQV